jgi:hypothetical protein
MRNYLGYMMLDLAGQRDPRLLQGAAAGSLRRQPRSCRLKSGFQRGLVVQTGFADEDLDPDWALFDDEKRTRSRLSIVWAAGLVPHSRGFAGAECPGLLQIADRCSSTS